jgi:hypothetical protein
LNRLRQEPGPVSCDKQNIFFAGCVKKKLFCQNRALFSVSYDYPATKILLRGLILKSLKSFASLTRAVNFLQQDRTEVHDTIRIENHGANFNFAKRACSVAAGSPSATVVAVAQLNFACL